MQTTFRKPETEIERLQRIRKQYYDEVLQDIVVFRTRIKEKIQSYRIHITEIDKDIDREQIRMRKNLRGQQNGKD